jgi:hypothetical protein
MLRLKPLLLVPLIALAGCAPLEPAAAAIAKTRIAVTEGTAEFFQKLFSGKETALEAVEIGHSQYCNSQGRESVVNLYRSAEELKAWETSRGVQLTPVTDRLPNGTYAIVEMGERNTGGWGIVVSRQAAQKDQQLYLKASYLSPKTSGMATQAITAPCALVSIRSMQAFGAATLLDQSNKVRARWTLANASAPVGEPPGPAPARLTDEASVLPVAPVEPAAPKAPEAAPVDVLNPSAQSQLLPADAEAEARAKALAELPLPARGPSLGQ